MTRNFFPFGARLRPVALFLAVSTSAWAPVARAESALCENGECAPAISTTTYFERPAYKLTDGKTEVIIVPQIGRIMRFGKVGGPNLLWNSPTSKGIDWGWKNYGGDKTWLAPQSSWPTLQNKAWPPDAAHDGLAHSEEVLSGGKLQLTSPLSSASGIRLIRTMYFDDNGEFVIEQTARKEKGAPVRASIWNITQAVAGQAVFLPLNKNSSYPNGYSHLLPTSGTEKIEVVKPNLLRVVPASEGKKPKIGVDSPVSSLVSVRDGVAFLQKSAKPQGQYPDGKGASGFPVELFINSDPKNFYYELELLGPLKDFSVGGKSTHTLRWSLHELPSKDVNSAEVADAVEKLLFG